jgi:hypothetical protein
MVDDPDTDDSGATQCMRHDSDTANAQLAGDGVVGCFLHRHRHVRRRIASRFFHTANSSLAQIEIAAG